MKLLIDMNLSPRWVGAFEVAGIDSVHWSTCGAWNAADSEIMQYAASREYVVLTHDLDFGAILAATQGEKPSVVQLRSDDNSPEKIGGLVISALQQLAVELQAGALLTIDVNRVRLRLLPLFAR
jgi:predicted nuclease of predicted toxin-antitoxin system